MVGYTRTESSLDFKVDGVDCVDLPWTACAGFHMWAKSITRYIQAAVTITSSVVDCHVPRYTRNGKLLGDGFVMVYESNLVPVVGFHSNGESVRVNFGVSPFLYEVRSSACCSGTDRGHRRVAFDSRWK